MRNFILATALLLTAGIAYAQTETAAETEAEAFTRTPPRPTRTPTTTIGKETGKSFFELKDVAVTDIDGIPTTKYSWTVSQYAGWNANDPAYPGNSEDKANAKQNGGWYNLSSTLVRYDKEAFSYTVFDVDNTSREWELSVAVDADGNVDMANSKNLISYRDVYDYYVEKDADGKASLVKGEFLRRVYYFTVPVGEVEYWLKDEEGRFVLDDNGNRIPADNLKYPVAELGVKVVDAVSTMNPTEPDLFYIIDSKQNETLNKNYYLAFGNSAHADNRTDPEIAFGQPLPAPLATLLIALGFGALFVMYRNRKQAKA